MNVLEDTVLDLLKLTRGDTQDQPKTAGAIAAGIVLLTSAMDPKQYDRQEATRSFIQSTLPRVLRNHRQDVVVGMHVEPGHGYNDRVQIVTLNHTTILRIRTVFECDGELEKVFFEWEKTPTDK